MFQRLQETFNKHQSDTTDTIKCLRCNKNITMEMFKGIFNTCPQKRCWIRRPQAREQAAIISNCLPNDFIPVQSGSINIHLETTTSTTWNQNNGWNHKGYHGD